VARPKRRYFSSMADRIAASGFPSPFMRITSRVISKQRVHVAAWLVKVTSPGVSDFT
jgi:hypothetical protein